MFNKGNKGLFAFILTLFMLTTYVSNAQEGESLFNSKCATCHTPHKDMTGPKLAGIRELWEENAAEGMLYQWVRNWRSEEHTSELQSRPQLVCRLLLEKKMQKQDPLHMQCHHTL